MGNKKWFTASIAARKKASGTAPAYHFCTGGTGGIPDSIGYGREWNGITPRYSRQRQEPTYRTKTFTLTYACYQLSPIPLTYDVYLLLTSYFFTHSCLYHSFCDPIDLPLTPISISMTVTTIITSGMHIYGSNQPTNKDFHVCVAGGTQGGCGCGFSTKFQLRWLACCRLFIRQPSNRRGHDIRPVTHATGPRDMVNRD